MGLTQVFWGETAECVCQGLRSVFEFIGGVPRRAVFDNATEVGRRVGGEVRLSELFREASLRKGADAEKADRRASKAKKGPMLVAFVTKLDANAEASADEQLIAAGAALENFLLALGSFGYGAIVLSDSNRDDPQLKAALGLDNAEALAGWITIGTPAQTDPQPESRDGMISVWR